MSETVNSLVIEIAKQNIRYKKLKNISDENNN